MNVPRSAAVAFSLMLGATVACSSKESSTTGAPPRGDVSASPSASAPVPEALDPIASFCKPARKAREDALAAACPAEDRATEAYKEQLDAFELGFVVCEQMTRSTSGRVTFHADAANRCLAALRAEIARDPMTWRAIGDHAGCEDIFEGDVPEGRPCAMDVECKPGLACEGSPARPSSSVGLSDMGTCEKPRGVGDACGNGYGQPYNGRHARCREGLYCNGETCVELESEGGPCWRLPTCKPGLECRFRVCTDPARASSAPPACDPTRPGACGDGFYCERSNSDEPHERGVCRARKKSGEKCSRANECIGRCSVENPVHIAPKLDPGFTDGVCVPLCGAG